MYIIEFKLPNKQNFPLQIEKSCIESGEPCKVSDISFTKGSIKVNFTLKAAKNQSVEDLSKATLKTLQNDSPYIVKEKSVIIKSSRYNSY